MNILPVSNHSINTKGVYFIKSNAGLKHIEDTQITPQIKERFIQDKFIKSLAEKFDTFISFSESVVKNNYRNEYYSQATISWKDETRKLTAFSECNNEYSTNYLFDKLKRKIFSKKP